MKPLQAFNIKQTNDYVFQKGKSYGSTCSIMDPYQKIRIPCHPLENFNTYPCQLEFSGKI